MLPVGKVGKSIIRQTCSRRCVRLERKESATGRIANPIQARGGTEGERGGGGFGYLGAFTTGSPMQPAFGRAVGSIRRYASNKRLIARDSSSWHRLL